MENINNIFCGDNNILDNNNEIPDNNYDILDIKNDNEIIMDDINDVLEFNNVNYKKISMVLTILNKYNNFKKLKLNCINDVVDICHLTKIIKLNKLNITIFISNSDICIIDNIETYKLYIYKCNFVETPNKITVTNTKYIEFNETYINDLKNDLYLRNEQNIKKSILLEVTDVEEFVYINTKYNDLQTKYIQKIEVNNCENYMIYNKNKYPLIISFPNGGFFLKTDEKICRNTNK